jgi:hypothetical protein
VSKDLGKIQWTASYPAFWKNLTQRGVKSYLREGALTREPDLVPLSEAGGKGNASRISDSCRYGKSASNCSTVRAADIASTIMPTVTRIPRMHGLPPIISGSIVMRLNADTSLSLRRRPRAGPAEHCRSRSSEARAILGTNQARCSFRVARFVKLREKGN